MVKTKTSSKEATLESLDLDIWLEVWLECFSLSI